MTAPRRAGAVGQPSETASMRGVVERLRENRLLPVIVIDDPANGVPLARALEEGGLPCVEITLRTARALQAIEKISAECPTVFAGAGTVLTPQQAADALSAGAKFIVAPGFNPAMVDYCIERGIPVFPGVATPSEIEQALGRGLSVLKFFPAEQLGGIAYLKAIAAPYGKVGFIPTGGIALSNLASYLASPRVVACGGSWIAPAEWIAAAKFDRITEETRKAVAAAQAVNKESK